MEGTIRQSKAERLYWFAGWTYDFSKIATIVLVIGLVVNYFFFSLMVVRGTSMRPTYVDGNVQLINRVIYDFHAPQRGDVVALYFPGETQQRFIKRIVGLPGETISISSGKVYINNQQLNEPYLTSDVISAPDMLRTLGSNEYFVMGDNREVSSDSRAWGPVPTSFIIGKVETHLTSLPPSNAL
jgi:signal peptidase I